MRLRVVYTGGTVGMIETPRGLAPGADLRGWLAEVLAGTDLADGTGVTSLDPLVDSSNTTPLFWQRIVEVVRDAREEGERPAGFVVLHGTDTMAYTSAALSYALTELGLPVVLTGSQRPLGAPGSDAAPNVIGALRAASAGRFSSVAVFFAHTLLDGPRVTKISSWDLRAFDSPNVPALAHEGSPWQWTGRPAGGEGWTNPRPYRRCDVAVVSVAPGITAERLAAMLTPLPEAVVIRAFGVGNIPSEEPGVLEVLRSTVRAGVPVLIASQCYQSDVAPGRYAAGYELAAAGAVGVRDMTLEAAYAKVCFLLSQGLGGPDVAAWIGRNIAGELTV